MYVVVKGDFRFGVTDVIGPFETEDAVWWSKLCYQVRPEEIYEVSEVGYEWMDKAHVTIDFTQGKIGNIHGPFRASGGTRFRVKPINEYLGLDDGRPTKTVLHKETIRADFNTGEIVTDECHVEVPIVTEEDLLSPKEDILREVVVSKQKDRWGLDNSVLFVDARSLYAG